MDYPDTRLPAISDTKMGIPKVPDLWHPTRSLAGHLSQPERRLRGWPKWGESGRHYDRLGVDPLELLLRGGRDNP
jgi:hypothetical protein